MDIFEKYFIKWLRKTGVVREGHFKLTSGRHSDFYIDKDVIYRNPDLAGEVVQALSKLLADLETDYHVVTGPAIAGALLAFPISIGINKAFVYPEKIDGRMVFRRGYDKFLKGRRVAIVEDIITTGGSVEKVIDSVLACGGIPVSLAAIWNRSNWIYPDLRVGALISRTIESWDPEHCPLCEKGVPLMDPKKGEEG